MRFFFTHKLKKSALLRGFGLSAIVLLLFVGCATHPTISATRMEKGMSSYGYTLSVENVLPYVWYRYAISDISNVGFRIGLPVYGTGIDYSRLLYSKGNKWDVINIAWSFNPNQNIDLSYYKFRQKKSQNNRAGMTSWWALRGMYIPSGIMGETSTRIGFLFGGWMGKKLGYELGYYHDFNSMPISSLFDMNWSANSEENKERFGDTPHKDPASPMPSEFSRLTGISFQLFFVLNQKSP